VGRNRRDVASRKRETIKIDTEIYALLRDYSAAIGVTITQTVSEAVRDWIETIGMARVKALGVTMVRREPAPSPDAQKANI
jgi:hypothetical protein